MDEKVKNAQEIIDQTEKEKKQLVHMVNKMSTMYDFIRENMHNTHWMDTDRAPRQKGLAGGLALIHTTALVEHTVSLINLTRWIKRLTIFLGLLTIGQIVLILGSQLGWF